jgi:hypothetical protein
VLVTCEWFAHCRRPAAAVVEHPSLGDVEICRHCLEQGERMGWPPTYMVPPIVARSLATIS